ncbi:MAG: helix-turn-helix domain-containing protein [Ruminococcus sp.]|nr:helix-turn-helix domain-containing protein [Ruminococcus sp.]
MDVIKTGILIRELRQAQGLTQKQLADMINVSDKAVSKWECGGGCPDISLIIRLAEVLKTDEATLLSGEREINESEKGNMKRVRFYVCPGCGNIITSSGDASVSCCGSRLTPLDAKPAEQPQRLDVQETDGELYITSSHEMTKDCHIAFVAFVNESTLIMARQYPEWSLQARLPLYRYGRLVWYSTIDGLLYQDIGK